MTSLSLFSWNSKSWKFHSKSFNPSGGPIILRDGANALGTVLVKQEEDDNEVA